MCDVVWGGQATCSIASIAPSTTIQMHMPAAAPFQSYCKQYSDCYQNDFIVIKYNIYTLYTIHSAEIVYALNTALIVSNKSLFNSFESIHHQAILFLQ